MQHEGTEDASVSSTEAEVLLALFRSQLVSEEERIRSSGVARTTYLTTKKRVLGRGLVRDVYLPNPLAFGRNRASFVLVKPFADELEVVSKDLAARRTAVVVWRGRTSAFAVFLHENLRHAKREIEELAEGFPHRATTLSSDLTVPTVPAYFDYEGAWSNLIGHEGVSGYPRPLSLPVTQNWLSRGPTRSQLEAAARLARRPYQAKDDRKAPHLQGPQNLKRSDHRLLRNGLVQWRVMPSLTDFPRPKGIAVEDLVFLHGALLDGVAPAELFTRLVYEARSYPILFATDGAHVLVVGVAGGRTERMPRGRSSRGGVSVASTLRRCLHEIEILREPLSSLSTVVDHRYDILFGPKGEKS